MWILGLAAVAAMAGQQAEDAPLKPSGAWGVDYGASACTLSRSFGSGDSSVSLGFIPVTGGEAVKIVMIGNRDTRLMGSGLATLAMTDGAVHMRQYFSTTDRTTFKPIALVRARRADLAAIAEAQVLKISTSRPAPGRQVRFALPGMASALKALADCEAVLSTAWGYDAAKVAENAKPIAREKWFTERDYPQRAMEQREAGETDYRVMVSPEGKPTDCVVTLASGSSTLDKRTCATIMSRATFVPAKDAAGKPVAGIHADAILWMLERSYP